MALSIKLVRHGESQANVGIVNTWEVGDHTVELTPKGHDQARAAGALIGAEFFAGAIAYSSPFRRSASPGKGWAATSRPTSSRPS